MSNDTEPILKHLAILGHKVEDKVTPGRAQGIQEGETMSNDTEPILKHLAILGHKVKDKVTGFKGVATSVSFDLYGCIQIVVNPGVDKDNKPSDSHWFDVSRLTIVSKFPALPVPSFTKTAERIVEGKKGASEKPSRKDGPC